MEYIDKIDDYHFGIIDDDLDKCRTIYDEISDAIKENNFEIIDQIMSLDGYGYSFFTPKEREGEIFWSIYELFTCFGSGEKFLTYIIFDYGIDENILADRENINNEVKIMFELRRTNEELSSELNISEDKNTKKMKI